MLLHVLAFLQLCALNKVSVAVSATMPDGTKVVKQDCKYQEDDELSDHGE